MSEDTFHGVALAVGAQSALGTVNGDIAALSGTIDEGDGCVLGRLDAGDAKSGITLPTHVRVGDMRAQLASYTDQPSDYLRTDVEGLSIAIAMQGNGATVSGTPGAGECKPLAGDAGDECVHSLFLGAGFSGANGTPPVYEYTPAATPTYLTAKLWHGDVSFVYMDCLLNMSLVLTPGGIGVVTFSFSVGALNAQADGVTFPSVTYGTQTSLSAPRVRKLASGDIHTWGTARGFNTYTLTVNNNPLKIPDAAQTDGFRYDLDNREIRLASNLWVEGADTDFEYEELIRDTITSTAITTQVGAIAGGTDTANAYQIYMGTPEVERAKYNKLGTKHVVDCTLKAVAASAGAQFKLTFN
jgi:hypothetical protein